MKAAAAVIAAIVAVAVLWMYLRAPHDYYACVMNGLTDSSSNYETQIVEESCLNRFPQSWDWDEIATSSGSKTWRTVTKSEPFQQLSRKDRDAAKDQFFHEVISPQIPDSLTDEARRQFMRYKPNDP